MPNRPQKVRKRPSWNRESDYWLREHKRQQIVDHIFETSDKANPHTGYFCPGCDFELWEAYRDGIRWLGCHCGTFSAPPNHPLASGFDVSEWKKVLTKINVIMEQSTSGPNPNTAC